MDGISMIVKGGPWFHKNEKVVLFLEKTSAVYYRVIALSLGKFSIVYNQSEGREYVKRDLSSLRFADSQGSGVTIEDLSEPETMIDLESFLRRIESHLGLP